PARLEQPQHRADALHVRHARSGFLREAADQVAIERDARLRLADQQLPLGRAALGEREPPARLLLVDAIAGLAGDDAPEAALDGIDVGFRRATAVLGEQRPELGERS